MANRLVISDDGSRILVTIYPSGDPAPLAVVELTVEQAVTLTAELTAAVSRHLTREYRR